MHQNQIQVVGNIPVGEEEEEEKGDEDADDDDGAVIDSLSALIVDTGLVWVRLVVVVTLASVADALVTGLESGEEG